MEESYLLRFAPDSPQKCLEEANHYINTCDEEVKESKESHTDTIMDRSGECESIDKSNTIDRSSILASLDTEELLGELARRRLQEETFAVCKSVANFRSHRHRRKLIKTQHFRKLRKHKRGASQRKCSNWSQKCLKILHQTTIFVSMSVLSLWLLYEHLIP